MNFDEADELFSDETMQSMQMAQVNGGVLWAPVLIAGAKWLCGIIGTTAAGIAIYEFVKSDDNNAEQGSVSYGPTLPFTTAQLDSLTGAIGSLPGDSTKVQMTTNQINWTIYNPGQ